MPRPVIEEKRCKGCFTCVDICPVEVFERDEEKKKAKIKDPDSCIGCRACEAQCPEKAITIED